MKAVSYIALALSIVALALGVYAISGGFQGSGTALVATTSTTTKTTGTPSTSTGTIAATFSGAPLQVGYQIQTTNISSSKLVTIMITSLTGAGASSFVEVFNKVASAPELLTEVTSKMDVAALTTQIETKLAAYKATDTSGQTATLHLLNFDQALLQRMGYTSQQQSLIINNAAFFARGYCSQNPNSYLCWPDYRP